MNLFSEHNKTLKKTELLRVNLMRLLAAFELLYYHAALRKHDRVNVLNDIKETNQD
jgi:regulatory protein YycI of two-component signal transduction system YycFG